jgi:N-glycosidase YbiA
MHVSAGQIKKLGREIKLPLNWDVIKEKIMRELVLSKFSNDEHLKDLLLKTGNVVLEEANNWGDVYWGVDTSRKGQNTLGKILMEIRSQL